MNMGELLLNHYEHFLGNYLWIAEDPGKWNIT